MTMKTSLLMFSLSVCCLCVPVVHGAAPAAQQDRRQVVTLDIQNMNCPLCQFTVKKALQYVKGVRLVAIDYDSKTAEVSFDPQQTGLQDLLKATTDAGYPATIRINPQ